MVDEYTELMSRPAKFKIFVSSRTQGLELERAAAIKAIERNPTAEAWHWEHNAHPGPYPIDELCLANARTSDGFVLILGEDLSDIVVKEFEAAHQAGVPCYPFIKNRVDHNTEVLAFVDRLRRLRYVTRNFSNCSELQTFVTDALNFSHVFAVRRVIVWERSNREQTSLSFLMSRPNIPNAYELILGQAEGLLRQGRTRDALNLLVYIKSTSPELRSDRHGLGWVLNLTGLAHEHLGERRRAQEALEDMQVIGKELSDPELESTAAQNLGILSVYDGRYDEARELFKLGLRKRQESFDYHGATQLLLNLASLSLMTRDFDEARTFLSVAAEGVGIFADPELKATLYGLQGNLAVANSDYVEAESKFRRALGQARRCENGIKELWSLQDLGAVNSDLGLYVRSLRWYRRALSLSESMELPRIQLDIHLGIAMVSHRVSRHVVSIDHLRKARELARAVGDRQKWAQATADLGAILLNVARLDEAAQRLDEAREVFQDLNDREWQVRILFNQTILSRKIDEVETAAQSAQQALDLLGVDEHERRAELLEVVAEALLVQRQEFERSADFYDQAIQEHEQALPLPDLAYRCAQIGAALSEAGAASQSLPFYNQAARIFQQLSERRMMFHTLNDQGNALVKLDKFDEARRNYLRCLEISTELDDRAMHQQACMNYGELLRRMSEFDQAIAMLQRSVDLAREVGDDQSAAWALSNLSIALGDAGRWQDAEFAAKSSRNLARTVRDSAIEAGATGSLARVEFAREHYARAARLYKRAADLGLASKDKRHAVEDLGGLVQSLSALGRSTEMEEAAKQLVNISQESALAGLAADAISRAARWWLSRDELETASELYAISILLAASGERSDSIGASFEHALVSPAVHGISKSEHERENLIALVLQKLDGLYADGGDLFRDLMRQASEIAWQVAAPTD